jgi:hypothetical protein
MKFVKTATETQKMLGTHYENEVLSHMHVLELYETFRGKCEDLKMIQGVCKHHLLDTCKHLKKLMTLLPQTAE